MLMQIIVIQQSVHYFFRRRFWDLQTLFFATGTKWYCVKRVHAKFALPTILYLRLKPPRGCNRTNAQINRMFSESNEKQTRGRKHGECGAAVGRMWGASNAKYVCTHKRICADACVHIFKHTYVHT